MRGDYTDEFEAFQQTIHRETYLHLSGRKTGLDLEPAYDRYADLFRREALDELRAGAADAFYERERKACRLLLAAAAEHHCASAVRSLTEELAAHESRAMVSWDGRDVPLRAARALLANEPRADARRDLASRRERVVEETNDLRAERVELLHAAALALGAASYAALWTELRGIDYAGLASASGRLLAATERPFLDALEPALRERAGVRLGEAAPADALRATRLPEFDRAFPRARLAVAYRDALAGLGIRAGAQPNIALDLDERPSKSPRPFCSPIRMPEEVKLVLRPGGGYPDYAALLRQAGRAQHYGFTSPEVRVEFARAGDRALSEGYGFLLQSLALERDWLQEAFGLGHARQLQRIAALGRCLFVRRLAGTHIYEEEVHAGRRSLAGARDRYAELLSEAAGLGASRAEYLAGVHESFLAADLVRACALEVPLRDHLKTRFGHRWWADRAAGELLKELWSTGGEYSAGEIASELRLGAISFDALEADLVEGLEP